MIEAPSRSTDRIPFEPLEPPHPPGRHRSLWRWLVGIAGVVVVLIGGAIAAAFAWSGVTVAPDRVGLARVDVQALGGSIESVHAVGPSGRPIRVAVRHGVVKPLDKVAPGTRITVHAVVKRPSTLGWLLGSTESKTLILRAPVSHPRARWLSIPHGSSARVKFNHPVHTVAFGSPGHLQRKTFNSPTRSVDVGGGSTAGQADVASAPRSWETLGRPVHVTWFPATGSPTVVSSPAPGSDVTPSTPLRLTFSKPVHRVLGSARPALSPQTPGTWRQADAHTLVFQPGGYGAPMGTTLHATLPKQLGVVSAGGSVSQANEVGWTVPAGSPVRLEQLLAEDGYMPVTWKPSGSPVANTAAAQVRAAVDPPPGSFSWRFPNTPPSLRALWAHRSPVITKGALMSYESAHGMTVDGVAGPAVWHALIADAVAGKAAQGTDYNYVYVSMSLPEKLTLWHDGKTIFTTPANTGISQAPTAAGTYPVYLRESVGTMSGTNPDGSHYNDPGIRYISYFNGGDAVHAFDRASFGTPQSLGCVELPLASAARVYPYMGYGTLVTVQ